MMLKKLLLITTLLLNVKNTLAMSQEIIEKIGTQIWQNEASGRKDLLAFWSEKESFPSLGIGHNIWFPEGDDIIYTQEFPPLCNYLKKHNVALPQWLEEALKKGAPWKNREEFYKDDARTGELRELLVRTVGLQTRFMVDRLLEERLPAIIKAAPAEQHEKIERSTNIMLNSPVGTYALVDYLNFKGDGLNPKEESNGERWGLSSVLQHMSNDVTTENALKAFTLAAANKLLMLIEHSAPDYPRIVFLEGWMRRISTYVKDDILN